MKKNRKPFVLVIEVGIILTLMVVLQSCHKHGPSDEEIFMGKLAKTWSVSMVALGGQDVTSLFPNLTLTFASDKTYIATNQVTPVWKASGSFKVSGTSPNYHLMRDEGIDVTVIELGAKLILEFQYDKAVAGARVHSVSGKYHFEFQ